MYNPTPIIMDINSINLKIYSNLLLFFFIKLNLKLIFLFNISTQIPLLFHKEVV